MTNYNDGNWHGHNGGECPVHPKSEVEFLWKNAGNVGCKKRLAGHDKDGISPGWSSQVVAFRVIREHVEPREVWMRKGILSGEWHMCREGADGAVLFREVQP